MPRGYLHKVICQSSHQSGRHMHLYQQKFDFTAPFREISITSRCTWQNSRCKRIDISVHWHIFLYINAYISLHIWYQFSRFICLCPCLTKVLHDWHFYQHSCYIFPRELLQYKIRFALSNESLMCIWHQMLKLNEWKQYRLCWWLGDTRSQSIRRKKHCRYLHGNIRDQCDRLTSPLWVPHH